MKNAFEVYIGSAGEVDNAQLALWFNEAQLDLAYEMGPVRSMELRVNEGAVFSPDDCCLRILASDLDFCHQPDGTLMFSNGGSGKLYYRAMPLPFTGIDDDQESELPLALHYLPALFAASRYWDSESEGDGEESAMANKWMSYYFQGKNQAKNRLDSAAMDIDRWQIA